jgi:hypothetical protein
VASNTADFKIPHDDIRDWMAGESFVRQGQAAAWTEFPSWEDLSRSVYIDASLPMFKQFLTAIGRREKDETFEIIEGLVNTNISVMKNQIDRKLNESESAGMTGEDLLRNEPLFITTLKSYLKIKIDEWVGRD